MKPALLSSGISAHSRIMTRLAVILFLLLFALPASPQGGDQQVRAKADQLFNEQRFAEAMPLYSQLVSLSPADRVLNYRFGACLLFSGEDKEKAIAPLKFATGDPGIPAEAWYWLGRAYHLNYRFKEAQQAYQRFVGTGDKKALEKWPVTALEKQCRNGEKLLSNLKEIDVRNKVEVDAAEFFRFYDLSDIGGKVVVTPDELRTSLDRKNKHRGLIHIPANGGPIYFSSYGKDGKTGIDIYRTELLPTGSFATPVKLGGYINTDEDDDHPFMHPDGRTFYFSSKGHNSMGGYDVFRAVYDKGLDTFGRPENLDFAVNTPDDDIFYLTDPEHKEACFASGRNSRQGQLHVYRVSTRQQPLILTVIKGTFASDFDKEDRKARIMVYDALTGEQAADVRTDINGGYVLSLPRSGRYRYAVECGAKGLTHGGMVEVPKSDVPRAYRQELVLQNDAGNEKLVIRNYFDQPLDDDLVALALDEIKRRARLDVTPPGTVVAEQPAEEHDRDIMTRAGFTGDIDEETAMRLAREDAQELEQAAVAQKAAADEAYAIALSAVGEAEQLAREAEAIVASAAGLHGTERDERMTQAARLHQRSREAHLRARAAYRTAQDLELASASTTRRSVHASKLANDLQASLTGADKEKAMPYLETLRERLAEKARPDPVNDPAEKARAALAAHEQQASRTLARASAASNEQSELIDRINRLRREQETARGAKKEELARTIATYEEQLGHLRTESAAVMAAAREEEDQTAVLRGQASLTSHLTRSGITLSGKRPTDNEVATIAKRIGTAGDRIANVAIDERYSRMIATTPAEMEAHTFAWDLVTAAGATTTGREATRTVDRNSTGSTTDRMDGVRTDVQTSDLTYQPGDRPARPEDGLGLAGRPDGTEGANTSGTQGATSGTMATTEQRRANDPVRSTGSGTERTDASDSASNETDGGASGSQAANTTGSSTAGTTTIPTPEQVRNDDDPASASDRTPSRAPADGSDDPEMARFVMENELAELHQLRQAARDHARRDSLDRRIDTLTKALQDLSTSSAEELLAGEGLLSEEDQALLEQAHASDMARIPLPIEDHWKDEAIVARLYHLYPEEEQKLQGERDADARAAGLHALELALADSLRGEMVRQLAILELDPGQAARVLPRVDRLRRLRAASLDRADGYLNERRAELDGLAEESSTTEGASTAERSSTAQEGGASVAMAPEVVERINDHFVAIPQDDRAVYSSEVQHRSSKVLDAVAFKNADLDRIAQLQARIDSLNEEMKAHSGGREYERLEKQAYRLTDEKFIILADMGQRSAFLTGEERRVAEDSLKQLEKRVGRLGLSPSDPLLVMAQEFRNSANARFNAAQQDRKRADRIDDIVERDKLYRKAFTAELEALRELDKALTVQNYLLDERHTPGEALTYYTVAARVLGLPEEATTPLVADVPVERDGAREEIVVPPTTEATTERDEDPVVEVVPQRTDEVGEETVQPGVTTDNAAVDEEHVADAHTNDAAGTTAARSDEADPAAHVAARKEAMAYIERMESRLPPEARRPAVLYGAFLDNEAPALALQPLPVVDEPAWGHVEARGKAVEAADLEARALAARALADAQLDSATTAKRRDRDRLMRESTRNRQLADSLHAASVLAHDAAVRIESEHRAAETARQDRERLVKYYYLTAEDMRMVEQDGDRSRYFAARARALEQHEHAAAATAAATSNGDLGRVLAGEAATARRGAAAGAEERARVIEQRSQVLLARADSLREVAARLKAAATLNESQAAVMLQGMDPAKATELMAMEMRTRRTEELLARTTPAPERVPAPAQADARPTTTTIPPSTPVPARERIVIPDVLTGDIFEMRPASERRPMEVPIDAPMPSGIVFKVQVGAFRNEVPADAFSDMTPLTGETTSSGLIRYTAGMFTGIEGAQRAQQLVRERGYRDAFVVAYRDGKRIPVSEAVRASAIAAATTMPTTTEPTTTPATTPTDAAQRAATTTDVVTVPPTTERSPVEVRQPVVVPTTTAPEGVPDSVLLARYPATAEEVIARFEPAPEAASYYNVPGAAPATQVETVRGLFFTVQVGVYSRPVALDKLFNITPLNSERLPNGTIRYTTGTYGDTEAAAQRRDEAVRRGVKDAFITAYLNGQRLPVREANALLNKFGPSILAKP